MTTYYDYYYRPLLGVTPGVPTLSETILALTSLDAFWKLNETTGTVAADSSGNGYDLASYGASPATLPPAWGQAAGPPGETSAEFAANRGLTRTHHTGYTTNFTMLGWFQRAPHGHFDALAGQGFEGNTNSWGIVISNGGGTTDKLIAQVGTTAAIASDSTLSNSTWYMAALTRGASTWHLYVNGVQQTATSSASPGSVPTTLWLGNDNFSAFGNRYFDDGLESYWALIGRELTAAEILNIYNSAGAAGTAGAGMVYTNPGSGGAPYWAYPTIEVTY